MGDPHRSHGPAAQPAETPWEAAKRHLRSLNRAALAALEHLNLHPDDDPGPALSALGDVHLHADAAETALTGRPPTRLDWCEPGRPDPGNGGHR